MKTVYFVRHGESEGNVGPIRQRGTAALTENGIQQAQLIAARAAKLPIEAVISSSMTRAKATAEIIAGQSNKTLEYSDLFVERRRPSAQLGVAKNDPKALEAENQIWENYGTPGFRHSDEENFEDLKSRALAALKFLKERPEKQILVVTHGFIMRIIVAVAVMGESLTGAEAKKFIEKFHMENTGITVLSYGRADGKDEPTDWWLWIWNDHAHLG